MSAVDSTRFCSFEVEVSVVSRGAHWCQDLFGMFEVSAANNGGEKPRHGSCPNGTVDAN